MRKFLFSLLFASLSRAQLACFLPNGTDTNIVHNTDTYVACGASNKHSMCCRTNASNSPDSCRLDGLCQNGNAIWREACTDQIWGDGCVKLCVDGIVQTSKGPVEASAKHVQVSNCDDGSFCCGAESDAKLCCDKGQGVWLVDGKVLTTNPDLPSTTSSSRLSSTSSSAPVSSTTMENSPSPSNALETESKESGMSVGAIVGIAIGTAGIALIIGCVLFVLRRRNAASKKSMGGQQKSIHYSEMDDQGSSYAQDIQAAKYAHVPPSELQDLRSPVELSGHDHLRELPT